MLLLSAYCEEFLGQGHGKEFLGQGHGRQSVLAHPILGHGSIQHQSCVLIIFFHNLFFYMLFLDALEICYSES